MEREKLERVLWGADCWLANACLFPLRKQQFRRESEIGDRVAPHVIPHKSITYILRISLSDNKFRAQPGGSLDDSAAGY
jgi:hypothetical protein